MTLDIKKITKKARSIAHDVVNGCDDKDAIFVAGSEKKNGSLTKVYIPKGTRYRLSTYVNRKLGVVRVLQ